MALRQMQHPKFPAFSGIANDMPALRHSGRAETMPADRLADDFTALRADRGR